MDLARFIDHTLLKPTASTEDIRALCAEALSYQFFSVCVHGMYVPLCAQLLSDSSVTVCAVVGFPLGMNHTEVKRYETQRCIADGAREIDMVLAIGALKEGRVDFVHNDIATVATICHQHDARLKVILETAMLSDHEKRMACQIAEAAGADFVKTCTGFGGGEATVEDVALMRSSVSERVQVKASGGIRSVEKARALIEAGATRLGTSASVALVAE